jgi:hypothetical protein
MALGGRTSGEHYFAYEIAETKINFLVRLPHAYWPFVERLYLKSFLHPGEPIRSGFVLLSFWQIAILDLVLGPLMWMLILTIVGKLARKALVSK